MTIGRRLLVALKNRDQLVDERLRKRGLVTRNHRFLL